MLMIKEDIYHVQLIDITQFGLFMLCIQKS